MNTVSFSEHAFSVEWGPLEASKFDALLHTFSQSKKAVLVDENTHEYCLEFLLTSFEALANAEVIVLPAGEQSKVLEICTQVWETLTEAGFGRHDLLINLGGGMVSDLGGFAASIFKRGIAFINIPTSLLAIVDASIGAKTGIDFAGYKNQIGTFAQPKATFIDLRFLSTLPHAEWKNGYAELLKHALISDPDLWLKLALVHDIQTELDQQTIQRGVEIKQAIVVADPLEKGLRKILNFGHTIGHAIESYYLHSDTPVSHGHAVAIGMLLESHLSMLRSGLSKNEFLSIEKAIKKHFTLQIPPDIDTIWELMQQDKKNQENEVRICLLSQIGTCQHDQKLEFKDFERVYRTYLG